MCHGSVHDNHPSKRKDRIGGVESFRTRCGQWAPHRQGEINILDHDICRIAMTSLVHLDDFQEKAKTQNHPLKKGPMTPAPFTISLVFIGIPFQYRTRGSPDSSVLFLPLQGFHACFFCVHPDIILQSSLLLLLCHRPYHFFGLRQCGGPSQRP